MQELADKGVDDDEMFELVKSLHMNHDLFLYYQSAFNTPRWTAFMEHAEAIPLARVYVDLRKKEYNAEWTERQVRHSEEFGE